MPCPPEKRARGEQMDKKQIMAISMAVAKHATDMKKDNEDDDDINAFIMSLQSEETTTETKEKKPTLDESTKVNTFALKSILCDAKNSS